MALMDVTLGSALGAIKGTAVERAHTLLDEIGSARCIAVNGMDCSGKTTLAHELLSACKDRRIEAKMLHVDDFNDLAVQSRIYSAFSAGKFSSALFDEYYRTSINYAILAKAIENQKRQSTGVLIVEGVFLFKPPLLSMFDYKVFIEIDVTIARERYTVRKIKVGDTRPVEVFDEIWLPAFVRYCSEVEPEKIADTVLGA